LDATLVKGSHGSVNVPQQYFPILVTNEPLTKEIEAVDVYDVIWNHLV
jgi:hypothetical protein